MIYCDTVFVWQFQTVPANLIVGLDVVGRVTGSAFASVLSAEKP